MAGVAVLVFAFRTLQGALHRTRDWKRTGKLCDEQATVGDPWSNDNKTFTVAAGAEGVLAFRDFASETRLRKHEKVSAEVVRFPVLFEKLYLDTGKRPLATFLTGSAAIV